MRSRTTTVFMTVFALGTVLLFASIQPHASAQAAATATLSVEVSPTPSGYSALLDSEIRGIDPKTIDSYRKGEGAGFALPAELNGFPGPRHVLDLADKLHLTSDQRAKIQALYDSMKPQAIDLGNRLLEGEATLEKGFRDKTLDAKMLQTQLTALGELQTQLRFVHLSTHLATMAILTPDQVVTYNMLRGYMPDMPGMSGH